MISPFSGRQACTYGLGLADLGVQVNPMNSKIVTDEQDSTHCGSVFAIGDVADVRGGGRREGGRGREEREQEV